MSICKASWRAQRKTPKKTRHKGKLSLHKKVRHCNIKSSCLCNCRNQMQISTNYAFHCEKKKRFVDEQRRFSRLQITSFRSDVPSYFHNKLNFNFLVLRLLLQHFFYFTSFAQRTELLHRRKNLSATVERSRRERRAIYIKKHFST